MKSPSSDYKSSKRTHLKIQNEIREKQRLDEQKRKEDAQRAAVFGGASEEVERIANRLLGDSPENVSGTSATNKAVECFNAVQNTRKSLVAYHPNDSGNLLSIINTCNQGNILYDLPTRKEIVKPKKGEKYTAEDVMSRYGDMTDILSKYRLANGDIAYILQIGTDSPFENRVVYAAHLKTKGKRAKKADDLINRILAKGFEDIVSSKDNGVPYLTEGAYADILSSKDIGRTIFITKHK